LRAIPQLESNWKKKEKILNSAEFLKQMRQRKFSCPFCDTMWKKPKLSKAEESAYETHLLKVHGLER
jgi:hypothetical protein